MPKFSVLVPVLAALLVTACGAAAPTEPPAPPPTAAPTQAPSEPTAPAAEPPAGATTFVIDPSQSEARFVVDEILSGQLNTVIGATSAVEGSIDVDFADASTAVVGPFRIDLSTLQTDNSFRNRALRDFILETGNPDNQFAVYTLTSIEGLPAAVEIGQTYPVRLIGELLVKGTTSEVVFDGEVTALSESQLAGSAATTVRYQDLGVSIPRLPPQVASVEEEMRLEIEFVATTP